MHLRIGLLLGCLAAESVLISWFYGSLLTGNLPRTCRPRHKREGAAAKRWEGLVFSTAGCSRDERCWFFQ